MAATATAAPKAPLPLEASDVLRFWFTDTDEFRAAWFARNDAFDAEIRERFLGLWERAAAGALDAEWGATAVGALALVVVMDQFPRNVFRGTARAFATDARALAVAKRAVALGFDKGLPPNKAVFLYLPYEHSESLQDQDACVELMRGLGNPRLLEFAAQHQRIVQRFGRFPHRNAALGRESTPEETEFMKTHAGF